MVSRTKKPAPGPARRALPAPTPTPKPTPAPSPGGVEPLSSIASEIEKERQAEAQQGQQTQQQQAKVEHASANAARAQAVAEIVQFLKPVRDMADATVTEFDKLPAGKFAEIWSDKKLEAIAEPLIVVMERHGEAVAKFMTDWMPYFALAGATLMPSIATVKAMRQHEAINVKAREVQASQGGQGGGQQQPT
jgi:hypothetical protein